MSMTFNGGSIESVTYNGNQVNYVTYNGTEVWRRITSVAVPTLSGTSFETAGSTVGPTVSGFNSSIMTQSGTVSANTPGTYTVTWTLKDTTKYCWADGTTAAKSKTWIVTGSLITFYVDLTNSHYQTSGGSDWKYNCICTFKVPYGKTWGDISDKTYKETTGAWLYATGSETSKYSDFTIGAYSGAASGDGEIGIWGTFTSESSSRSAQVAYIGKDKVNNWTGTCKEPVAAAEKPVAGTTYYAYRRN